MTIPEAQAEAKAMFDDWNASARLCDPASAVYGELIERLSTAVEMGAGASRVAQDEPQRAKALGAHPCLCEMCQPVAEADYAGID
jgi:hypothetical protein